jgi:hypothetical protein
MVKMANINVRENRVTDLEFRCADRRGEDMAMLKRPTNSCMELK